MPRNKLFALVLALALALTMTMGAGAMYQDGTDYYMRTGVSESVMAFDDTEKNKTFFAGIGLAFFGGAGGYSWNGDPINDGDTDLIFDAGDIDGMPAGGRLIIMPRLKLDGPFPECTVGVPYNETRTLLNTVGSVLIWGRDFENDTYWDFNDPDNPYEKCGLKLTHSGDKITISGTPTNTESGRPPERMAWYIGVMDGVSGAYDIFDPLDIIMGDEIDPPAVAASRERDSGPELRPFGIGVRSDNIAQGRNTATLGENGSMRFTPLVEDWYAFLAIPATNAPSAAQLKAVESLGLDPDAVTVTYTALGVTIHPKEDVSALTLRPQSGADGMQLIFRAASPYALDRTITLDI